MNRFEWFYQLRQREQWILVVGGAIVLFYLCYLLLWRPLHSSNAQLEQRNVQAAESLQWMRASAADIKAGKDSAGTKKKSANANLTQLLDTSVSKFNMQFSRFQPKGSNKAQVWFDATEFASLVAWLDELHQQNIYVTSISLNSTQQLGRVNASVALQQY